MKNNLMKQKRRRTEIHNPETKLKSKTAFKEESCIESAASSSKIKWSYDEDIILEEITNQLQKPIKDWIAVEKEMIAKYKANGIKYRRNAKQCRERYLNHLEYIRREWTKEEEEVLLELNKEHGNKWVEIANLMGRKDGDVKNQYYACYRKRIRKLRKEIEPIISQSKVLINEEKYAKLLQTEVRLLDLNAERMIDAISRSSKVDVIGLIKQSSIASKDTHLTNTLTNLRSSFVRNLSSANSVSSFRNVIFQEMPKNEFQNGTSSKKTTRDFISYEDLALTSQKSKRASQEEFPSISIFKMFCEAYNVATSRLSLNLFVKED